MKYQVWAVSLVRDEEDIIEYTLRHLVAQGIDAIIIHDNNSKDHTVDVVRKFQESSQVPVIIYQDKDGAWYFQSKKMTDLVNVASSLGAKYIIPFDADELWYAESGRLADVMRDSRMGVQAVQQKFYFCSGLDDSSEANPYKRIKFRESGWAPWSKICFKWFEVAVMGSGNHTLLNKNGDGIYQTGDYGIKIAHFPCRSFRQFVRKIIRHGVGYDAQYPKDPYWGGDAPVQRQLYRIYQSDGEFGLMKIWNNTTFKYLGFSYFDDPFGGGIIYDPAPYLE